MARSGARPARETTSPRPRLCSGRRTDRTRRPLDAGNWQGALSAFEEAAGLIANDDYVRAELLHGAALAARSLGRDDLPARLERAWRAGPSMLRLRRWLGSAQGGDALRRRAAAALEACPARAACQRAFLHLIKGEFDSSAELLSAAPGLGWSDGEHPDTFCSHCSRSFSV